MTSTKQALVTGAANGLGKGFVEQLVSSGYKVIGIDIDKAALDQLTENHGENFVPMVCDLMDETALRQLIEALKSVELEMAVLNAGISATGNFERIAPEAHSKVLQLNTVSALMLANALAREEILIATSHLVFISSLSHAVGYPGAASYAASKDAVAIYAKSVRKPFARTAVSVSCAFPGPIRTEHAARHAPTGASADKRTPPDEMARQILKGVFKRKATIYPGFAAKASRLLSFFAPSLTTRLMRRVIFEKLDKDVW